MDPADKAKQIKTSLCEWLRDFVKTTMLKYGVEQTNSETSLNKEIFKAFMYLMYYNDKVAFIKVLRDYWSNSRFVFYKVECDFSKDKAVIAALEDLNTHCMGGFIRVPLAIHVETPFGYFGLKESKAIQKVVSSVIEQIGVSHSITWRDMYDFFKTFDNTHEDYDMIIKSLRPVKIRLE